jgi:hypothetical protein
LPRATRIRSDIICKDFRQPFAADEIETDASRVMSGSQRARHGEPDCVVTTHTDVIGRQLPA